MAYVQKKISYVVILLLFVLAGCSTTVEEVPEEQAQEFEDPTIIVAYGDSLTEGLGVPREDAYPAQLERALIEKGYEVKVFNSGYSGETSTGALERIEWILQLNPDIVIFTTGANDAFRGIDISIIESNMREVIERMQEQDIVVVLGGMEIVENLGPEYVTAFESLYPTLAQEYSLPFIPVFLEGVAGDSSLNQPDEIHPTKEGYEIVVKQNVLPVVEEVLQELLGN